MKRKVYCTVIAAVMLALVMAGCGKEQKETESIAVRPGAKLDGVSAPATEAVNEERTEAKESEETDTAETQTAESETVDDSDIVFQEEHDVINVANTEELLEAIAPNTLIYLEPGYYNMSEYMNEVWAEEGASWNERHDYVKIQECFEGLEFVISDVSNLVFWADTESDITELVIEPRYGDVMTFVDCSDISFNALTIGHVENSDCEGNVLNFFGCQNVSMNCMDLYGCGVFGIGAYDGSGEFYVQSSKIRDCSYGPFDIQAGNGVFEFRNCWLVDNDGSGAFDQNGISQLSFYECVMGEWETNSWYFHDDVIKEECVWSEITSYPDYSDYESIEFNYDNMTVLAVDFESMIDTGWDGYMVVDSGSGETVYLAQEYSEDEAAQSAFLALSEDGTGWMEYRKQTIEFTWGCEEDGTLTFHVTEEDWYMYATMYADDSYVWMMLQMENDVMWLY